MYEILIAQNTHKEYHKLPSPVQEKIRTSILSLESFPDVLHIKKLSAKDHIWRMKVGAWRVIFCVNKEDQTIKITHIRKRNEKTYRGV